MFIKMNSKTPERTEAGIGHITYLLASLSFAIRDLGETWG